MTIFTFPAIQVSTAGLATEAEQQAQTALLTTMDANIVDVSNNTFDTATSTNNIDTKTPNLGQALMAASVPVTIASNQSAVPVSASSLPLPTGAATESTLSTLNAKVTAVNTGAVVVSSSALPTGAATESTLSTLNAKVTAVNTGAVVVSSSALPTGAATESTLSAASAKLPAALGQTNMAGSMSVTIASNQTAVPASQSGTWTVQPGNTANTTPWLITQTGRSKANAPLYNDYTSTAVTTSAYVQLVASTTSAANRIEIFDSSGEALFLAVGGSGSEVDQLLIYPGGNGIVDIAIPASSRISIKAKTATASNGFIIVNLYT